MDKSIMNAMKTVFYGNHKDQFGQLHRPDSDQICPVMIVIHGGFWKDNHTLNSYATQSIVEHFRHREFAIWNLEYRRMNFQGDNTLAPWPAVFEDIAAGIDHLRTIAKLEQLDLDKVLVIGHSAGGHLATWATCRNNIPVSSPLYNEHPLIPTRAISIAGILDLTQTEDISQPQQVLRLMGGTPEQHPERYAAANPQQLQAGEQPITIIHGKNDQDVSIHQAETYVNRSPNPNLRYIPMDQAKHFGMLPLNGDKPADWDTLKNIIQQEITRL